MLFAFLLARKFSELGENTISGALDRYYGRRVRTATSMIMVCSLLIVAVFNAAGDDRRDVLFLRAATVVTGLVPIALALFATDVLTVTFLAKSLRAALAVLVLLMFYAPRYGTRTGAFWAIVLALPTTTGWFLLGDPFGIDNAYMAVATPLLVMTCTHLTSGRSKAVPAVTGEKR